MSSPHAVMWVLNWARLIGEILTEVVSGGRALVDALAWQLALPAVVILAATVLYLKHPARIIRQQGLRPLEPTTDVSLQAEVERLAGTSGLKRTPNLMLRKANQASGQAFGLRGRHVVRLDDGLRLALRRAPQMFRAIVLHELAHIVNRDIGRTYFAQALWSATLWLAVIPYLAVLVAYKLIGSRVTLALQGGLTDTDLERLLATSLPSFLLLLLQACGAGAPPVPAPAATPAAAPQVQQEPPTTVAAAPPATAALEPAAPVPTAVPAGPSATGQGKSAAIQQVIQMPGELLNSGDALLSMCVDAFFQASIQNGGQPTTTGTLRQGAYGALTYSATPSDALVLIGSSGETVRFTFGALEGDFSVDTRQLLRGNHRVGCTIDAPDALAVELAASRTGPNATRAIRGTIWQEGIAYKVDLQSAGLSTYDPDAPAHESSQQHRGSVAFGDVAITVDEDFDYNLVNTVERIRHRIGSTWTEGSGRYSLQDGYYQLTLKEGRLAEPDYWRAQGTLLQDNQAIGQLEMRVSGASGRLVLAANGGEIVVKSWE